MVALRVFDPCPEDWGAMRGTERVRRCEACDREVHDLRRLKDADALAYAFSLGGASMCARVLVVGAALTACAGPAPPPPNAPSHAVTAPGPAAASGPDPAAAGADSDGDGILDADDACPQEPGKPSANPARNGCPAPIAIVTMGIVILPRVVFPKGSATVLAEADAVLGNVRDALRAMPEGRRLEIRGHASNDEPDAERLAEERARAVLRALVALGVDNQRLSTRGFGMKTPIAPNDTPENRAVNRRVDFYLLDDAASERAASCAPAEPASHAR
jgi:outer membrane protein OmpA-like peptidoglycan-associated protein